MSDTPTLSERFRALVERTREEMPNLSLVIEPMIIGYDYTRGPRLRLGHKRTRRLWRRRGRR